MEQSLKKISKELKGASKMHKGQADKIDSLLSRKDNKAISKMIGKVKNSNCGSPSKALVFQPKNLNKHLNNPPPSVDSGSKESEESEETGSEEEAWGVFSEKNIEKRQNKRGNRKKLRNAGKK